MFTKKKNMEKVSLTVLLCSGILLGSSIDSYACERSEQAMVRYQESESICAPGQTQFVWTKRGWKRVVEEYAVQNKTGESIISIASKFMYKNTYPNKDSLNREVREFSSGIVELNYDDVLAPLGIKDIYGIVPYGTKVKVSYWVCG